MRKIPLTSAAFLSALTPEALKMKEQYDDVTREMENIYYKGFTDAEAEQFESFLKRILSNLEENDE